jgi:hypothetical protein
MTGLGMDSATGRKLSLTTGSRMGTLLMTAMAFQNERTQTAQLGLTKTPLRALADHSARYNLPSASAPAELELLYK